MKPHELLTVFLKAIGIWFFVNGLEMLPDAMRSVHKYDNAEEFFYLMMGSFGFPAVAIIAGMWLFVTTDIFVGLAFPNAILADVKNTKRDLAPSVPYPDLLSVVLKAIGAFKIVHGIATVPLDIVIAHRPAKFEPFFYWIIDSFGFAAISIIFGFCLVFKTGWFVRFAYPEANPANSGETKGDVLTNSSHELLGVITKALGVWFLVYGVARLPSKINRAFIVPTVEPLLPTIRDTIAPPAIVIICGCVLFFATNWVVGLAFPEPVPAEDDETIDSA